MFGKDVHGVVSTKSSSQSQVQAMHASAILISQRAIGNRLQVCDSLGMKENS
jgi:hypothetical protein